MFHLVVRDLIACFDQHINTESVLYHVVYVFITWLIFSSRASFRGGSQLKIIPGLLFYLENMQRAERVFSSDSSYSVLLRSIFQSCDCVPHSPVRQNPGERERWAQSCCCLLLWVHSGNRRQMSGRTFYHLFSHLDFSSWTESLSGI